MSASPDREILNIDEAAALLGVSVKTFNKVLHSEDIPARKIGREWKFSRQALITWVGSGRSSEFYREGGDSARSESRTHAARGESAKEAGQGRASQRTPGWRIERD